MSARTLLKLMYGVMICLMDHAAYAQDTLLQKTSAQLAAYQNFAYKCTYKQKEVFSDTLTIHKQFTLLKAPAGTTLPYLFHHQFQYAGMDVPAEEIYNGKELIQLNRADSTFTSGGNIEISFQQMLPAKLAWLRNYYSKHPSKLNRLNDTLYHTEKCWQLRLTTKDTLISSIRQFVHIYVFINQKTGLPAGWMTRARTNDLGKEVTDYYTEEIYDNYLINQPLKAAYFEVPPGFHSPKNKTEQPPALLATGGTAPDWTLYDTDGQKITLSKLKGRIVLLDFFFVGCVPCMKTFMPLDSIYRKYQKQGLVILSISNRDNQKSVAAFKKAQRVETSMLHDGSEVAKQYHVINFPTVYMIDRQGTIASVTDGYSDDLGSKISGQIEKLLKNGH